MLAFARFADKRRNSTRARRHKKKIENKRNVIGCVHISVRGEDCENFSFAFRDTHRYENRILNFAINSGSETFGASHIFVSFFWDSADIPHTLDTGLIIVLIISRGDSNTIPNAISPLYSPIGESEHSYFDVFWQKSSEMWWLMRENEDVIEFAMHSKPTSELIQQYRTQTTSQIKKIRLSKRLTHTQMLNHLKWRKLV